MSDKPTALPRLLYLADVPVEASYHGSALLYRLLQNHPPDRLRIIEGNLRNSVPERRLRGVAYRSVKIGWRRMLNTRFNRWVTFACSFGARWRIRAVRHAIDGFQPEAVLTVAHGFLWLTAAEFARRRRLALHMICHDDWPSIAPVPEPLRLWLGREFGRVYRQARSRFCVSPFMAEQYHRRYGVPGAVLYPSRAVDAPRFEAAPERLLQSSEALTVVFAGTINSVGYIRSLLQLAESLDKIGGRLLIFGPLDEAGAAAARLKRDNIQLGGMVPSGKLMNRLRAEADVLFVPMSFAPQDSLNMQMGFPSKLTDFTAVALPLLIYGPAYCSAARWGRDNPGVAEVVTEESPSALGAALVRLSDRSRRNELAITASRVGNEFFSHSAAEHIFFSALRSCPAQDALNSRVSTVSRPS